MPTSRATLYLFHRLHNICKGAKHKQTAANSNDLQHLLRALLAIDSVKAHNFTIALLTRTVIYFFTYFVLTIHSDNKKHHTYKHQLVSRHFPTTERGLGIGIVYFRVGKPRSQGSSVSRIITPGRGEFTRIAFTANVYVYVFLKN